MYASGLPTKFYRFLVPKGLSLIDPYLKCSTVDVSKWFGTAREKERHPNLLLSLSDEQLFFLNVLYDRNNAVSVADEFHWISAIFCHRPLQCLSPEVEVLLQMDETLLQSHVERAFTDFVEGKSSLRKFPV